MAGVIVALAALSTVLLFTCDINSALPRAVTSSYLHRLGVALAQYAEANHGLYPPDLSSVAACRKQLAPLLKREQVLTSANLDHPQFLGNGRLSGKTRADQAPGAIVFFDSAPWPEGTRRVLLASGAVKTLTEKQFQEAVLDGFEVRDTGH